MQVHRNSSSDLILPQTVLQGIEKIGLHPSEVQYQLSAAAANTDQSVDALLTKSSALASIRSLQELGAYQVKRDGEFLSRLAQSNVLPILNSLAGLPNLSRDVMSKIIACLKKRKFTESEDNQPSDRIEAACCAGENGQDGPAPD